MGSGDGSNPSDSSPSHPLLEADTDPEDQLAPISYVRSPRPARDLPALLLFLLLSAATFALGILALASRNPDFPRSRSFVFDPSAASCVPSAAAAAAAANRRLSGSFAKSLIITLILTLLLSGPLALALLYSIKRFAKQLVYAAVPLFILIPALLNVYWFTACQLAPTCRADFPLGYRILVLLFVFLLIGIVVWIVVANWRRVELTVRIMRTAAAALAACPGLLALLPALSTALLLYFAPIVVFLVFARYNGRVVPRLGKGGEYVCEWREDGWVPAYFALAVVTMVWSAATMVEAQVYVICGTIAQWYFAEEEAGPSRSLRSSLRNAFGPSFGTVCFSGMIFGAVRVVRAIVDSAKREDSVPGIVNLMLQCCAKFLLSACEFVNKFTINFAAITGEGYCSSAKMTYELLKRNLLSAVFVETVSTRVLAGIIFVLSTLYAIAVCAILKAATALDLEVYLIAGLAWLLLIVVLGYFVHVLDNVVDTVYVCYAIDRDKGEVCKQEVHEVYVQLPLSRNHRPKTPLIV